ncbi:MAG: lysophospholipase, partial [Bacteroidota bacterium]
MPHHETHHSTSDGKKLYLQGWEPEGERKAAIFLVHGLGEHSGRYVAIAQKFVEQGFAVYTFDGRGHGKSSQPKVTAYIEQLEPYLEDVDALFQKMKSYVGDVPCFILGHSMGGALVAHYSIFRIPKVAGILLSGAGILPGPDFSPLLIKVAGILGKLTPKFNAVKLASSNLSRDPQVVKAYDEDPLVYHKGIPARTGAELLRLSQEIQDSIDRFSLPVLIMHGTADRVTNV